MTWDDSANWKVQSKFLTYSIATQQHQSPHTHGMIAGEAPESAKRPPNWWKYLAVPSVEWEKAKAQEPALIVSTSSPPALAVSNDSFWMKLWWMTVLWTQERMIIGGCHPVDGWIQKSCNVIWHDESDSSLRDDGRCTKYGHFGAGVLNLGADSARGTYADVIHIECCK